MAYIVRSLYKSSKKNGVADRSSLCINHKLTKNGAADRSSLCINHQLNKNGAADRSLRKSYQIK